MYSRNLYLRTVIIRLYRQLRCYTSTLFGKEMVSYYYIIGLLPGSRYLETHLNASKPSEHPSRRGKHILHTTYYIQAKTATTLIVVESTGYNVGEKPNVLYCTLTICLMFGVLGPRCCTRPPLLDCHVLKEFGIYMIGILGRLYGCMEESQLASPRVLHSLI